ncbi:HpaII family restriction endonuclease [Enterococcus sp. DIV1314a]|uniref:HpaII family restriction endonuclease n=1 Tax=Enterococcus sp. DIV1314a TaxID=2774660 RepID=UPI003F270414
MIYKGNIGEWSEFYVLVKLLAEGVLYGADADLNLQSHLMYNILSIFTDNNEYRRVENQRSVLIQTENENFFVSFSDFDQAAQIFSQKIKSVNNKNNVIPELNPFIEKIKITKIKKDSTKKSDITIKIHDVLTGSDPVLEFSIKSQYGKPATLLNSSQATNFIYKIEPKISNNDVLRINGIRNKKGGKVNPPIKIKEIESLGSSLQFVKMNNDTFDFNLKMIDYSMPKILAEIIYEAKKNNVKHIKDVFDSHLSNLSDNDKKLYEYKVKKFLMSSALGMVPGTKWDGNDEATGGYIVVKDNGELACFHLYNRNALKDYLFNNVRFEEGSKKKHFYGDIYEEDDCQLIKINLAFRFIK